MFIGDLIGGVTGGGGLGGTSTSAASGTSPQDQTQSIYFGGARKNSLSTWAILAALGAATFYVVRSKK